MTYWTRTRETTPYSRRDSGVLHRNAITAVDKVANLANTDITTGDNGSATGSLLANTIYYTTIIPGNRWGPCLVATTINTRATAASGVNTHSIRLTWAQVTGADYYDLFLSTAAAPLWVARVTEAQRAAGDYEVTAVGTVAAGGGNPAGTIDVNVAGTGIATSNSVFAQNNAYRPDNVTVVNCAGYSRAHALVRLALTDLRSAPSLSLVPFLSNQVSGADYHQGTIQSILLLTALGRSLEIDFVMDVEGSTGIVILVDTISGQGASCSVWIELA